MPTGFPVDVGTVRIRSKNGVRVRLIKVRNGGPIAGRWIRLARFTWEQKHGPVPPGKRVVHRDGNTLNDHPDNYTLMTSGEFIRHCHFLDPEMAYENRFGKKRRAAIAEVNRDRGAVDRTLRWQPSQWYVVDFAGRRILNVPFKSRRLLAALFGLSLPINGRGFDLPVDVLRGMAIEADQSFLSFQRVGNHRRIKTISCVESFRRTQEFQLLQEIVKQPHAKNHR